jgi:hypothetical protein
MREPCAAALPADAIKRVRNKPSQRAAIGGLLYVMFVR